MELASSEFKSHVGSLEAWALAHGVAVDRTKKALRLITSSKRVMLWAFPNDNGMQLSLEPLRRARNNELADMVVDVCSRIAGKAAAPNYPGINAALAVARWDELVESILDPPAIA